MPRSVRLWMERRSNSSGHAPSHGSSTHSAAPLPREWNQSAQGVDLAGRTTAMGGQIELVPGQQHHNRSVNGSNRLQSMDSGQQQQEVVKSVQSSASSHTRLGCSKDWALHEIFPGRGSRAGEQHFASETGTDSRRSASPATQSSWEIDSRTGSSCPASEAAAVPDQHRNVHVRSVTALKAACNAGSLGQVSAAASESQAGLHNRPARESKGTAKARQNVRQRRTNNAQVEKQAFR